MGQAYGQLRDGRGLAAGLPGAQLSSSSRDSESTRALGRSCRSFPGPSRSGPSLALLVKHSTVG